MNWGFDCDAEIDWDTEPGYGVPLPCSQQAVEIQDIVHTQWFLKKIEMDNKRDRIMRAKKEQERKRKKEAEAREAYDKLLDSLQAFADIVLKPFADQVDQILAERRLEAERLARKVEAVRQAQELRARAVLRKKLMVALKQGLVVAQKVEAKRKEQEQKEKLRREQMEEVEKKKRSSRKYLRELEQALYFELWRLCIIKKGYHKIMKGLKPGSASAIASKYCDDLEEMEQWPVEKGLSYKKVRAVFKNFGEMMFELNPNMFFELAYRDHRVKLLYYNYFFGKPALGAEKLKHASNFLGGTSLKLNPLSLFSGDKVDQGILKMVLFLISLGLPANRKKKLLVIARDEHQAFIKDCLEAVGVSPKQVDFWKYNNLTSFGPEAQSLSERMTEIKKRLMYILGIKNRDQYPVCLMYQLPYWNKGAGQFLDFLGRLPHLTQTQIFCVDNNLANVKSQEVFKAIPCHPQSSYGQAAKGQKQAVLTSLGSSLLNNPQTLLFSIEDKVANLKKELSVDCLDHLEFLCSKKSGEATLNLIKPLLKQHGGATSSQIKSWLPYVLSGTIDKALQRACESGQLEYENGIYSIPQRKKLYAVQDTSKTA